MLRFGQNLELQLHVSSELRHTGSLLLQTLVRPCHVHTCSALRSAWQKWDRSSFSTERGCLRAGVRPEPRAPRNQVTWSPLCPRGLPRFSAPRGQPVLSLISQCEAGGEQSSSSRPQPGGAQRCPAGAAGLHTAWHTMRHAPHTMPSRSLSLSVQTPGASAHT